MLQLPSKRPTRSQIEEDRALVLAFKSLPDYAPTNPACSTAALVDLDARLEAAIEEEMRLNAATVAARQRTNELSAELHATLIESKLHVVTQYGRNATLLQLIGLKRLVDRRKPVRRFAKAE